MASLVANYGSGSDSELDSEDDTSDCGLVKVCEDDHQEKDADAKSQSHSGNLLMGGDDSMSDSSDDDTGQPSILNSQKTDNVPKLPNPMVAKMPSPSLGNVRQDTVKNSVFANPFLEAETAKHSILEKHVKMTEHVGLDKSGKTRKQMCYKFQKGKCRFGTKCKYSHDLDNVPGVVQQSDQVQFDGAPAQTSHSVNMYYGNVPQEYTPVLEDQDSYMAQAKKKRKSGVTDTLQPPKRALKDLSDQRSQERPWTMKR